MHPPLALPVGRGREHGQRGARLGGQPHRRQTPGQRTLHDGALALRRIELLHRQHDQLPAADRRGASTPPASAPRPAARPARSAWWPARSRSPSPVQPTCTQAVSAARRSRSPRSAAARAPPGPQESPGRRRPRGARCCSADGSVAGRRCGHRAADPRARGDGPVGGRSAVPQVLLGDPALDEVIGEIVDGATDGIGAAAQQRERVPAVICWAAITMPTAIHNRPRPRAAVVASHAGAPDLVPADRSAAAPSCSATRPATRRARRRRWSSARRVAEVQVHRPDAAQSAGQRQRHDAADGGPGDEQVVEDRPPGPPAALRCRPRQPDRLLHARARAEVNSRRSAIAAYSLLAASGCAGPLRHERRARPRLRAAPAWGVAPAGPAEAPDGRARGRV